MVRAIVWTRLAEIAFKETLQYFNERNKSNHYSIKLAKAIKSELQLLSTHPNLGLATSAIGVRYLISGNYKIFYRVTASQIIILMVWDGRMDSSKINIEKWLN